jgi:hypothetical protein
LPPCMLRNSGMNMKSEVVVSSLSMSALLLSSTSHSDFADD